MDFVTLFILILSTVTSTFGLMQLGFWFADRRRTERLAFFVACFGSVCFALLELAMALSATPERYLYFHWIAHPFSAMAIIGTAWFVDTSLGTGRRWLFWSVVGLRMVVLIIHLALPNGINWAQVTEMVPVMVFGNPFYVAKGVAQPTNVLPLLSFILLFVFAVDTSIRAWRPGERIRVAFYGFGAALFALVTPLLAAGILFGFLRGPVFVATTILFVILAMSCEMLIEMQRAAGLSDSLKKSEADLSEALDQLHLSAEAGEVGLWRRNFAEPVFWANEKAHELFGFEKNAQIGPLEFLEHVHEDDRERVVAAMKAIEKEGDDFDVEFRIRHPDGVRWIYSRGDIIRGEPMLVRGASVDVTEQKLAEQEAHDLARKLINAQEEERSRLARDLHDHLSQSIALLSIRVGGISRLKDEPERLSAEIADLTSQLQVVGADVHRISHELHPAKLRQLGLEVALGGFCREIEAAHGLKVNYAVSDMPPELDGDLEICFYRVAQEALQNIVKHGKAGKADVRLGVDRNELVLEVSDDGCGFDAKSAMSRGTLGLVSMSERMLAVSGESKIDSTPRKGTRIVARAPIENGRIG